MRVDFAHAGNVGVAVILLADSVLVSTVALRAVSLVSGQGNIVRHCAGTALTDTVSHRSSARHSNALHTRSTYHAPHTTHRIPRITPYQQPIGDRVDFSLIGSDEDVLWTADHRETPLEEADRVYVVCVAMPHFLNKTPSLGVSQPVQNPFLPCFASRFFSTRGTLFLFCSFFGGFFGPVDVRETCFGPCVVAGAYAAVVDSASYTGIRWLICTCGQVLGVCCVHTINRACPFLMRNPSTAVARVVRTLTNPHPQKNNCHPDTTPSSRARSGPRARLQSSHTRGFCLTCSTQS